LRWLAAAGLAGTATELAMLRHWTSQSQRLAWAALGALAIAFALTTVHTTPARLGAGRLLAGSVALFAAVGVLVHVRANVEAGPLDFRYAARWPTMGLAERWWAAATGAVGPAPALAPAILAQTAVLVWLASIGQRTRLLAPGEARHDLRQMTPVAPPSPARAGATTGS
jgi:hypothetical protein